MIIVARHLQDIIDDTKPRLLSISENRAAEKPYSEKWSIKETLGHLIDSACSNHQRIVRMQATPDIGKFSYEQLHWVNSQHYKSEPWTDIVNLWYFYNKHRKSEHNIYAGSQNDFVEVEKW